MSLPSDPLQHSPRTPSEWRQRVFWLALPIIFSNITVPLVGIVDTAVMGRMESPDHLSATAIGAVIFSSIYWVFGFLRMGTSGLVSQAIGADEHRQASRSVVRSLFLAVLFGCVVISASSGLLKLGLLLMDTSASIHQLTQDYFFVRIVSAPATLTLYTLIGAFIGLQRMRYVFTIQLLLNCSNILLTLLFFYYTNWGIKGVAAATVISEYLAASLGVVLLLPLIKQSFKPLPQNRTTDNPQHTLDQKHLSTQSQQPILTLNTSSTVATSPEASEPFVQWLFNKKKLLELFNIGGNLFVRTICLTAAFFWLTALSSRLGAITMAVNAVLIQMLHFMAHGLDGFSDAAETLTGHAYGKRDRQALNNAVKAAFFWGALLAGVFTLVYAALGGVIFDLMTTQQIVRDAARTWLPWIAVTPIIGVWSFLLDGIYIGTTHTREMRNGMIAALLVFIAATQVLVPLYNNHGLWMSYIVLMLTRAVTLGLWYPRILKSTTQRAI